MATGSIAHGTWNLNERSGEGGGMRFVRLTRYLDELHEFAGPIDRVYYENITSFMVRDHATGRVHESSVFAAAYGGIKAHILSWCEIKHIPYRPVAPGTVKSFATGKGNAAKADMIKACAERLKLTVADDNDADACWVLLLGEALEDGLYVEKPKKSRAKRKRAIR